MTFPRFVLTALLTHLVATPARADWVSLFPIEEDEDNFNYYDSAIRKDGVLRRVWVLMDHKKPDSEGSRSTRLLFEFDCNEKRYRVLSGNTLAGPKGTGKAIHQIRPTAWDYMPPGVSTASFVMHIACDR